MNLWLILLVAQVIFLAAQVIVTASAVVGERKNESRFEGDRLGYRS